MKISEILKNESGHRQFYVKMYDANDYGEIENSLWLAYINSLDNHKQFVTFLIQYAGELTEQGILTYTEEEISDINSVNRTKLIEKLTDPRFDGLCYEIYNNHIETENNKWS